MMTGDGLNYDISYGKARVPLYRVHARPLSGVAPVPESSFTGRGNTLFAAEVAVEVFGENFLPSYIEGDNSSVVATDSMKNFILSEALAFDGATLEGFLAFLGRRFLDTYPQMQRLRLTATEQPFSVVQVPDRAGEEFGPSDVLFSRSHGDRSVATLECAGRGDDFRITTHRCGRVGLQLIKITGSSFTRFVRDEHTTLPERVDRPLFIHLDVHWIYADPADMLAPMPSDDQPSGAAAAGGPAVAARYVAAEQVRDVIQVVFHDFVSESIQHLVNEMGRRLLARFPHLATVSFDAQNHTWDPVAVSDTDERVKVYTNPFPAYGLIHLTLTRNPDR